MWVSYLLLRTVRAWHRTMERLSPRCVRERGRRLRIIVDKRLVLEAWAEWRRHVVRSLKQKRFANARREERRRGAADCLRDCVDAWADFTVRRAACLEAQMICGARTRTKIQSEYLAEWKCLFLAVRYAYHKTFTHRLRRWKRWTDEEARRSQRAIKARSLGGKTRLRRGFALFREGVSRNVELRNNTGRIVELRWTRANLRNAWDAWQSVRGRIFARFLRPRQHYVFSLLRKCVFVLKVSVLLRARLDDISARVRESWRQRRLSQDVFPRWHSWARSRRERNRLFTSLLVRYRTELRPVRKCRIFLCVWWQETQLQRKNREKLRDFRLRRVVKRLFDIWHEDFTVTVARPESLAQLQTADRFCTHSPFFRVRFFNNWRHCVQELRRRRLQLDRALLRWYTQLTTKILRGWRGWLLQRQAKNARYRRAFELFQVQTKRAAVRQILRRAAGREEAAEIVWRAEFEARWEREQALTRKFADRWMGNTIWRSGQRPGCRASGEQDAEGSVVCGKAGGRGNGGVGGELEEDGRNENAGGKVSFTGVRLVSGCGRQPMIYG